jgi:hypothetical protein
MVGRERLYARRRGAPCDTPIDRTRRREEAQTLKMFLDLSPVLPYLVSVSYEVMEATALAKTKTTLSEEELERRRKNAAYQATYRKTHLKEGEKKRLSLFIDHKAHRRLERIATHRELSVTALIEQWAEKEEKRIVAKMTTKQKHDYEDCIAQ